MWAVRNPRSAQAHREVEIPPIVQDGYVHGLPNRSGCQRHLAAFKDDGTDVALPKPLLSDLHDLRCELGFIWIHFMTKDRVSEVPRSIHSHDNHTSAILLVHPGALEAALIVSRRDGSYDQHAPMRGQSGKQGGQHHHRSGEDGNRQAAREPALVRREVATTRCDDFGAPGDQTLGRLLNEREQSRVSAGSAGEQILGTNELYGSGDCEYVYRCYGPSYPARLESRVN